MSGLNITQSSGSVIDFPVDTVALSSHQNHSITDSAEPYPASEFPFSLEAALESELENELPPLKQLLSTRLGPTLRRSSSSLASTISNSSPKTVRFASAGYGVGLGCQHHHNLEKKDEKGYFCSHEEELQAPVATVIHLTHSAAAYDRSSIVVDRSLRLPSRMDNEDSGKWVTLQECLFETSEGYVTFILVFFRWTF